MESSFKHSFKTAPDDSGGLSVYNSGFQQCTAGYSWGPGQRDHFLIHYVAAGHGSYTVGGQCHAVGPGDAFLVYPSQVVSYCADSQDPWEYYWVGFGGSQAAIVLGQTAFSPENPVLSVDFGPELQQALLDIYHARGSSPASYAAMTGRLYLVLALLIERCPSPLPQPQSALYVRSAIRFITHNYANPIDVTDIARHVGISRSNLFRVFVRHTQLSPSQYLTQFRVGVACALLEEGKMSVAEVANSVGYQDQLYFSRVFKKAKGVAPSKYTAQ